MARKAESSSIDAKRFPAPLIVGAVIMLIGFIIIIYGVISIVSAATDETEIFGLSGIFGGILILAIGAMVIAVGGAFVFFGTVGRLFGRGNKRIMY